MSQTTKQTIVIGGIAAHVYSQPNATDAQKPVAVLFLLHGRMGSAQDCDGVANATLQWIADQRKKGGSAQDLLIITLDQRNHGARTVDVHANSGWREQPPAKNDRHAIDMYAIHTGTARDVSFLIDFLPSFLYPSGERTISQWLIGGISLGGHATWYALRNEPRIKLGVPIIGCPDYVTLLKERAEKNGIPWEPPYIPKSLLDLIQSQDAASAPYRATDVSNPFLGKKILVLSGADDPLVPWTASKEFVDNLSVGKDGIKEVILAPGVGHKCTPEMVEAMSKFIWEQALSA
ncbi:alpha/beta-hydrolase [Wolfiporia cocos MD-104 SS10]|uniref:Alpha/beta-hydrolase n=1 Tax=Wolfiporia cocos (strain MD-104) TaxID=742152 RepID=A0A2H3JK34_WOLCO|nr:alpha/beta-hydrolase [Wolfiporia cocos MD-104 SS10]